MSKEQLIVAVIYLRAAVSCIETYGTMAKSSILAAKVYALLAYKEGDLELLVGEIRNEVEKGKN